MYVLDFNNSTPLDLLGFLFFTVISVSFVLTGIFIFWYCIVQPVIIPDSQELTVLRACKDSNSVLLEREVYLDTAVSVASNV